MRVAYIMSRFPNLTETFVLYEMVALERRGVSVDVYPLLRERQDVVHADALRIARRACYQPFLSLRILAANVRACTRQPRAYCRVLAEVLRGTWGSINFLIGAIGIFPKAVLFAEKMRRDGVEHIHAHFANHPTVAALIVHRLTGIPFSFTGHGHDIHIERRMLGAKMSAASFVVAISEYNKRLMLAECSEPAAVRIELLHCGTDTELFTPRTGARPPGPFTVIALGALIEVKGHRVLVEACRLLCERGVDVRADVLGEGELYEALSAQIERAGLTGRVVLHDAQPRERVVELLSAADAIVQSSVPTARGSREGIPISLMEGMASGLPVVASRLSGIPELVEEGVSGILVPPGDAGALADALAGLASDPQRARRFGAAGRARVLQGFDLIRNASRLERLFATHGRTGSAPSPTTVAPEEASA